MSVQFEFAFSGIGIANHTFLPNSTFQDVHTYICNHPKIQHEQLVQVQLFDNHDLKKPLSSCSKLPTIISVLRITHPRAPGLRAQLKKDPTLLLKHTDDVDTTKLLLQLNADPNTKGDDGTTPLHDASRRGQMDVARLLLQVKVDPNTKNNNGFTPLHDASIYGHMDTVRLLLQANADPNTKDKVGYTPFHDASIHGKVDTARLLLQANADPNTKNKNGSTPLHLASIYGYVDTVRLLLQSNADPNTKNNAGRTPLYFASTHEIKQLLESIMQPE
jgi:ankyrin repeat protein